MPSATQEIKRRLSAILPEPLKHILRRIRAVFISKEQVEMAFQKRWAPIFLANQSKVLEYWQRYRHLDELASVCGINDRSAVLDVGCGISTVLHYLPGSLRVGLDPLGDYYGRIYRYPPGITIVKARGEALPFADSSFDVVLCTNAIDHTTAPDRVVAEVRRVLKPGGHFALTVEVFLADAERDAAHPHCLSEEAVRELVKEGFDARLERKSPWISISRYVMGQADAAHDEMILVLRARGQG